MLTVAKILHNTTKIDKIDKTLLLDLHDTELGADFAPPWVGAPRARACGAPDPPKARAAGGPGAARTAGTGPTPCQADCAPTLTGTAGGGRHILEFFTNSN